MLGLLIRMGDGVAVVTPPAPSTPSGGGRYVRHFTERHYRKFTKKDERELKRLLQKVVEEESKQAEVDLNKKARELAEVANAAEGIKRAVEQVESIIKADLRAHEISLPEAKRRLEELEEEEDLLLLIAGEF